MAGARMLYAPNSRQDPDESFIPFDDRNYNGARDDPSHLQVYVETPPAISRKGTFINGHQFSPPFPSQTAPAGARRWTQADQSRIDSEKKKKAMKELVTSWQDRLQLISIITTFFAGMEAQLLGVVTPSDSGPVRRITQASLVGLSSALVVHTFAAILSFVAAFFLVRFRVKEAQHEEVKAELGVVSRQPTSQIRSGEASSASGDGTPMNVSGKEDSNDNKSNNNDGSGDTGQYTQQRSTPNAIFSELPIFSTDPHLEQVGPWRKHEPPIALLDHCHLLCMMLSAIGFILAMVGIMCYVWAKLPLSSRVVTSVFGGFCIALGFAAIFAPVSFAPVSRALQSPAMSPQGLPTLNEQQQPLPDKLPGPRG